MNGPKLQQVETHWREFQKKSLDELYILRALYTHRQGMLGNIPLIASTTPLIFFIFGKHVEKYLPSHNFWWIFVLVLTIVMITWSLNHHFRLKGEMASLLYLIDLAIHRKEKEATQ